MGKLRALPTGHWYGHVFACSYYKINSFFPSENNMAENNFKNIGKEKTIETSCVPPPFDDRCSHFNSVCFPRGLQMMHLPVFVKQ